MRKKILYTFFIFLLIANGVLLFMLISKSYKKSGSKDHFLTKELQFNKKQEEKFLFLDEEHRNYMRQIDNRIKMVKEQLFSSFSDTTFAYKEVIKKIGELEIKKEEELYVFFKSVRELCNKYQAKKFDLIIKEALHKRGPKGKRDHKRPPPPR